MQVLKKLTLENLRQNKRRTIVTIVGVILSSALILAVIGIVTSFRQMMIDFEKAQTGDYHEMYENVPADRLQYLEENVHIDSLFYSKPITAKNLPDNIGEEALETYKLYQHMPYPASFYEKIDELPAGNTEAYNVYVRYDKPSQYEVYREQILDALSGDQHVNYRTNSGLLRYEAGVMGDAALAAIISLAVIVIIIIIVTSVFAIRNSFSISATERSRQFGMLSSIGATPRQIRQSVVFEGLVIALIGIPFGLLIGALAVIVLVGIMNLLMGDMMAASVPVAMPWWIFAFAIGLSLITTFFSSLFPAIRASRLSPIVAIRGNQDIKIKSKKLHTPRYINGAFGIGGVIAYKNLKRSRKKYRTTVISIVISVATFIGLYTFLDYGQHTIDLQYEQGSFDLIVSRGTVDLYRDLTKKFNLKDSAYYIQGSTRIINVAFVEEEYFKTYAESLGIHNADYNKVAVLIDRSMSQTEKGSYEIKPMYPDLKDGDDLEVEVIEWHYKDITLDDGSVIVSQGYDEDDITKVKVNITKITDQAPIGFERQFSTYIFVSENYYLSELTKDPDNITEFFANNIDNMAPIMEYLDDLDASGTYDKMYYQDVKEAMAQSRCLILLMSIFLYGFIIVVTLIGVTNIFNTITTNIALRSKEFAMLKSVGMTSQEFNRMVRLESLMYVGKALLISLPLGLLLSYGIYNSFAEAIDFGYRIPWPALVISIVAVGLLIGVIMRYSVKQTEKQNIIETIRSDNI